MSLAGWLLGALLAAAAVAEPAALSSEESLTLLSRLSSADEGARASARVALVRSKDRSLLPHLVDALFFASSESRADVVACLEGISGEALGRNYRYWVEYIGGRPEILPKAGYRTWKASLFARIDPAFAGWLGEAVPLAIRPEEIVWGGVKKDGIPALVSPPAVRAEEARYLDGSDVVFGVAFSGEARAYPQRILDWHEMVNDKVGGQAFALSYCTLCGSAIAFATGLSDGSSIVFGSSGLLYRSNKLMYDRKTESLWSNLTGLPVGGALLDKGVSLPVLPVTVTSWADWRAAHPNTTVLSESTGFERDYTPGAAYGRYFASPETMFPVWKRDTRLPPKSWIFALRQGAAARAYPLETLLAERVTNDRIGNLDVVLVSNPESGAVRAYRSEGRELVEGTSKNMVRDVRTGEAFEVREEGLIPSAGGTALARVPGHRAYWFGWYAFFPDTTLYEGCLAGRGGAR
jgi:hypothetical protein